jgi:hypothetical protein
VESLVLGDIELLGGGVASTNPMCQGVTFRLLPGYDPGAPQPDTEVVASLLLDGELNYGRHTSNRTMSLPIWIIAPSRDALSGAREHIQQVIDAEMWTLTWARERDTTGTLPPLPIVFDCQRAAATKVDANLLYEKQFCMRLTIGFPALPFGRSDTQEQLRFASPAPGGPPAPPSPVVIDAFSTISSPTCFQSPLHVVGPNSCGYDPDNNLVNDPGGQNTVFTYTSVLANSLDLTGMSSVAMYLGFGSRYYPNLRYHGQEVFQVTLTLRDTAGNTISLVRNDLRLPVSPAPNSPTFSPVSLRIPAGDPVFAYTSLAGYTLVVANHHRWGFHHLRWVTMYVDDLTAYPDTITATPVTRGAVYTLRGLKGTARAPMSASFTQPPTAGTATTVTTVGLGTYTAPGGTAWLAVRGIGGGAPGASLAAAGLGAGGGAAESAREDVFPASPGDVIPLNVGAGGTPGNDGQATTFGPGPAGPLTLTANGGKAAAGAVGGLGGTGSNNSVHFDGGKGRDATGSLGAGGGSSGGTNGPGQTPMGTTATSFTSAGTTSWVSPFTGLIYAETWGSGAGGATGYTNGNGQAGSGGEYAAQFVPVTKGSSYTVVVAAGGLGANGANQLPGNNGNASTFTADGGVQVIGHGGVRGLASSSSGLGPAGGTGSGNAVHHDGGRGGGAEPYGGGGGSSGSPSGNGNNGDSYGNPGTAPTDGGAGGAGSGPNTSTHGSNGQAPGGGGGGTYFSTVAGNGAAGKVRLSVPGGTPDQFGAPAVAGGGAGGNGGATANSTGSAGSQPGGGGGGANSTGSAEAGGNGGAGELVITPFAPSAFKSLLVHKPPRGSSKYYQPLVSVGAGADVPNGATWYSPPQPVTGVNARYNGTYTLYLVANTLNGSGSRTVTVTARQTEYSGGPTYTTPTLGVSFTPAMLTNNLLTVGIITLPVKKIGPDNTQASFAFSVTDTNTADRWYDLIILDSAGQTVAVNEPTTGFPLYLLDAPDPNKHVGDILGTQSDRSAAVSVMGEMVVYSGGPMAVEPADGENTLFAYCPGALAPAVAVTYSPTYYFDRTV